MPRSAVRPLAFFFVAAISACAPQHRGSGAFMVTPLYRPQTYPVYLGLDGNHLFAHGGDANVDFDLEQQQDGCARGAVNGNPIEVCPVPDNPTAGSGNVKTYRLNGPLGEHTFTVEMRGDRAYVDFGINQGRAQFVLPEGLPRQHPEMVAAAFYFGAFGLIRSGSETQAYLIQPR
jgi:hypothetical protein